jgi:hypothetical protein
VAPTGMGAQKKKLFGLFEKKNFDLKSSVSIGVVL